MELEVLQQIFVTIDKLVVNTGAPSFDEMSQHSYHQVFDCLQP